MMRFLVFGFILSICCCLSAQAAVVAHLYEGQIAVPSQSTAQRNAAIPKAFEQVLIKVSGNASIATLPSVRASLRKASNYVQQYSYVENKASVSDKDQLLLQVKFDAKVVDSVLRQADQGIWPENRPLILAWVVVQSPQSSVILDAQSQSPATISLYSNARRVGLPILLPIMDLTDQAEITEQDIVTPNTQAVSTASLRYHPQAELVGTVTPSPNGQWLGSWTLLYNNQQMHWQTSGKDLNSAFAAITNNIASTFASRFAVLSNPDDKAEVTITVTNMDSVKAYADAMKYLRNLTPVSKVNVLQVRSDEVEYQLSVDGGQQAFSQAIANSSALIPVGDGDMDAQLRYRWSN